MTCPTAVWAAGAGERFARVEAFVSKHCVECHGGKAKKADIVLNAYHNEPAMLEDRQVWQKAMEMVEEGEMPPHKRPQPTEAESRAFLDTLGAMFDEADRTARPDPGRVTIRRLNRSEYNNTIRDLVGVDFQPAEDFPSDDIGNGFDNIGDVLSISPVLMERYLAAADSIMARAILVDPPKPPIHRTSARNLEPGGRNVPQGRFRPLTSGRLSTGLRASQEGDYVLRVRAYAPRVDEEAPRIGVSIDGKEIRQFDVSGDDEKQVQPYEMKLVLEPGEHRFAVTLLNATDDNPKRTVFVESISLEGPADTRPPSQRRLLACTSGLSKARQTREVLSRFASQAYRRPATSDEVERLAQLAERVQA
ncbi:MAG TPA: DUF1587 domain-containing protein, partial [Tepidisphaeraceae bacterium]